MFEEWGHLFACVLWRPHSPPKKEEKKTSRCICDANVRCSRSCSICEWALCNLRSVYLQVFKRKKKQTVDVSKRNVGKHPEDFQQHLACWDFFGGLKIHKHNSGIASVFDRPLWNAAVAGGYNLAWLATRIFNKVGRRITTLCMTTPKLHWCRYILAFFFFFCNAFVLPAGNRTQWRAQGV